MRFWQKQLSIILLLLLSACGFEPLYGTQGNSSVQNRLSGVAISPIPDRLGQLVHNHLSKGVRPDDQGQTRHRLEVSLDPSIEGFGFRSDESITRERVRLVARYQLIDVKSGEAVFDDVVSANTSIDVVQSDFATVAAEEKARERNAERVSQLILTRLALYFRAELKQNEAAQ